MTYVIFFVVSYLIIVLFYKIFVINKENALRRMKKSKDVMLVSKIGKIDIEKVDIKSLVRLLSYTNAFIVSFIGTIMLIIGIFIKNFYVWLIVTFISSILLLIPLIFLCYKLIGKKLSK